MPVLCWRWKMSRDPAEQIRHRLLIMESLAIGGAPPQGFVALHCFLTFVELDALIDHCFGQESEPHPASFMISLTQVGSPAHVHFGEYYLAEAEPGSDRVAANQLLADYDSVLEPVLSSMASNAVFDNDDFIPPCVDYWSWVLRRLAYLKLYGGADQWLRISARFKDEAKAVLEESPVTNADQPRIFTNVAALKRDLARRGAQEALTLMDALRSEPGE